MKYNVKHVLLIQYQKVCLLMSFFHKMYVLRKQFFFVGSSKEIIGFVRFSKSKPSFMFKLEQLQLDLFFGFQESLAFKEFMEEFYIKQSFQFQFKCEFMIRPCEVLYVLIILIHTIILFNLILYIILFLDNFFIDFIFLI